MCSEPLHLGDHSGFHLQCLQEGASSYKSKNEEFGVSRQPSFLTHCVCEQMFYLQLMLFTGLNYCSPSLCIFWVSHSPRAAVECILPGGADGCLLPAGLG